MVNAGWRGPDEGRPHVSRRVDNGKVAAIQRLRVDLKPVPG
jgi:hypothetical protein